MSNKKSNKKILVIFIVFGILTCMFIVGLIGFISAGNINNRVFTDISDFSAIEQYEVDEIKISDDKLPDNIQPKASYVTSIMYNGRQYSVFAYVFDDTEDASIYFKLCTGKKSDLNYNFSLSTNYLFSSKYIAYYDNCLYRIEGGSYKDFVDSVNFINQSFSIDLTRIKTVS